MCYRPLSIRIKPRNYNPSGGQLFSTNVSCCACPACQLSKKDEWAFRIFYEIDDTLSKGGFVLSQGLTYDNDHVPYLSSFVPNVSPDNDIMCFNRKHIVDFMKRLRTRLERAGYKVANSLRYFISSEYGSDPTKTRRPHYHGTFYSTVLHEDGFPLTWDALSSYIEDCWTFGRSDGVKTISREMPDYRLYFFDPVKPHVLLPPDLNCHLKFNKIADYVSKYVVKDVNYSDTIKERCSAYLDSLYVYDRPTFFSTLRKLKSNVKEFHLQSLGFGANLFKYNDLDDIMKTGCIKKPSADPNNGMFEFIPLPLYFARKLFMSLRKRQDKSLYWCYTLRGKEFFKLRYLKKIDTLYHKFNVMLENDMFLSSQVVSLLDARSLRDFVTYLCVYKGRSKPMYDSDFSIPSVSVMLEKMCSVYDDLSQTFNIDFKDGGFYTTDNVPFHDLIYKRLNYADSCFSQLDYEFRHFDDIFSLFSARLAVLNAQRDKDALQKIEFPLLFKNNYK